MSLAAVLLTAFVVNGAEPSLTWTHVSERGGGGKGAAQLVCGDIVSTHTSWKADRTDVICSSSTDGGTNWHHRSTIVSAPCGTDIGDGHLLQRRNGDLLFSYRHNASAPQKIVNYSIRVSISHDNGTNWEPHSVVAESQINREQEPNALRGLWSSFLFETDAGELQCYFDDEDAPHRAGAMRHQWVSMKTWNPSLRTWTNTVTVSRTTNTTELCRDGMPSVVRLSSGRLLAVFEAVHVQPPHASCIRSAFSDDGGRTWSWQHGERPFVFDSPRKNALAVSPWVTKAGDTLICVFATDEDRDLPSVSGTHPRDFRMDIKRVLSSDGGRTWSRANAVFDKTHRCYAPGILALRDKSLLVTFMDYSKWDHVACKATFR